MTSGLIDLDPGVFLEADNPLQCPDKKHSEGKHAIGTITLGYPDHVQKPASSVARHGIDLLLPVIEFLLPRRLRGL